MKMFLCTIANLLISKHEMTENRATDIIILWHLNAPCLSSSCIKNEQEDRLLLLTTFTPKPIYTLQTKLYKKRRRYQWLYSKHSVVLLYLSKHTTLVVMFQKCLPRFFFQNFVNVSVRTEGTRCHRWPV